MSPTVSFILPIYNAAPYLEECLQSIFAQTLPDFEIILVNDGSTDGSLSVCERICADRGNVRILDLPHRGVSAARNAGIDSAAGEYLCFMDADDFYTADFADAFYRICRDKQLDMIRGFYRIFREETQAFSAAPERQLSYFDTVLSGGEFLVRSMRERANEVIPVIGFFRRRFLLDHALRFPEGIEQNEDQLFFLRALLAEGSRILQTDTAFYAYRKHAGSATSSPTLKKAQDILSVTVTERSLLAAITDKKVRNAAQRYIGSSFFQLTCIYGRVSEEEQRAIRVMCPREIRLSCMRRAANPYQQIKLALFALCPRLLSVMYDWKGTK